MIIPVILAGGSGTRLWPLSRQLHPKQLLNLTDRHSMLQKTVLRVADAENIAEPLVICNETYRYVISEQLREIGIRPELVLEPIGRNTAAALAAAALLADAKFPDAVLLVLPADHLIEDVPTFHQVLRTGAAYAENGHLITFGVIPDAPETGYGYIRKGEPVHSGASAAVPEAAYAIREFVEKPDLATARKYVDSGEYCWNSGMFMFRAHDILEELNLFAPDILESCRKACDHGKKMGDAYLLDPGAFFDCRSDSIDYAVMEKTGRGVMIPFGAGWNDVGSWEALWTLGEKNADGNVIRGDVLGHHNRDSLVFAQSRLVAVLGVSDMIVVESPDAVLVASRARCQEVKSVVDALKGRKEARVHNKTYFPWGTVDILADDGRMVVRRVIVDGGVSFTVRPPAGRVLNWVVVAGNGEFDLPDGIMPAQANTAVRIDSGTDVWIRNRTGDPLVFTEIHIPEGTSGDHFGQTAPS